MILHGFAAELFFKPEFVTLLVISGNTSQLSFFSQVKREDIFITTKIPGPIGSDAVQKMVLNETLPKLGVEYVIQMQFSSLAWTASTERCLNLFVVVASCCIQKAILDCSFLMRLVHQASPSTTKPCCTCSATCWHFADPCHSEVDLLLIHTPCLDFQDFPNKCGSKLQKERLDTWHGITELRKQGKVRAIGVTCLSSALFLMLYEFVWDIAGLFSFILLAIARPLSDVFRKYAARLAITSQSKWRKPLSSAKWCKVLS